MSQKTSPGDGGRLPWASQVALSPLPYKNVDVLLKAEMFLVDADRLWELELQQLEYPLRVPPTSLTQ